MAIDYPKDSSYELRVKDTGSLDQFDVFVNGTLRSHVSDDSVHLYAIDHPDAGDVMSIAIHFEGVDGGKSAVVDVTDAANPKVVGTQSGLIHSFLLQGGS